MLGLINQAIERFARDTYGDALWTEVAGRAGLGSQRFEAMLTYDPALAGRVLDALALVLARPRDEVLEDIGTYLVTAPRSDALRRLLRFSGTGFLDFLYSLDDLPARARLAVPELTLPQLELREHTAQSYSLMVRSKTRAGLRFGHLVLGLLRAMADDYGALVLLEHKGASGTKEVLGITLLDMAFTQARDFDLGARPE